METPPEETGVPVTDDEDELEDPADESAGQEDGQTAPPNPPDSEEE